MFFRKKPEVWYTAEGYKTSKLLPYPVINCLQDILDNTYAMRMHQLSTKHFGSLTIQRHDKPVTILRNTDLDLFQTQCILNMYELLKTKFLQLADIGLIYTLAKSNRRLTFDIHFQLPATINKSFNGLIYLNEETGYSVISDYETKLTRKEIHIRGSNSLNGKLRSNTIVFPNNYKRDFSYSQYNKAIRGWAKHNGIISIEI